MLLSIQDFMAQRSSHTLVDVRSPLEFRAGHMIGATNIPLLNDEERIAVGTDYKQKGQLEAIRTGFRLVGPRLPAIIDETLRVANAKEILVHCWRGGMRSSNFCQFVSMAGIKSHQLKGGYKEYRTLALETFRKPLKLMLLTGYTGSGKSEVLRTLKAHGEQVLDLEDLASHKGSAFGGLFMPPQPTTEQFQNELFEKILAFDPSKWIWVEDESIAIGKIFLPNDFWLQMNKSVIINMNVSKEIRISRLVAEYGTADQDEFLAVMGKIIKRLGGQHYKAAVENVVHGDMAAAMDILLTYYDKAYQNGIEKRKSKILFSMDWDGQDTTLFTQHLLKNLNNSAHDDQRN
jgi:tRNA 2-selenouridine synthase